MCKFFDYIFSISPYRSWKVSRWHGGYLEEFANLTYKQAKEFFIHNIDGHELIKYKGVFAGITIKKGAFNGR